MSSVDERGRMVVRTLEGLRVHPALEEIGWRGFLLEIGDAARSDDQMSTEEPIFVTQTGLILSGFGRWRFAASRRVKQIECVEYSLTDENALHFMLSLQRRRNARNPFVRIRLALQLEKTLQQRALTNMQMGGKYKGSATLPKAAQIDVREQIAAVAGVGSRNVSKVKEILEVAHSRIKDELLNGSVRSFGLFGPRANRTNLAVVFMILGQSPRQRPSTLKWALAIKRDFGWDPLLDCKGNHMRSNRRIPPEAT